MAEETKGRLATVFDDATRARMASLADELPSHLAKLEAKGVGDVYEAAEHLCAEMERLGDRARELILRQPPKGLLGYVYSTWHMNIFGEVAEQGDAYRPNKDLVDEMQWVLEHVHAAWACSGLPNDAKHVDEGAVAELFEVLRELRTTTLLYCQMRSLGLGLDARDRARGDLAMRAMTAWVNLRGRRYQVLEGEFLGFVLGPHDAALRKCYGMGAAEIAAGVQLIADTMRTGFSDAVEQMGRGIAAAGPDGPEGAREETVALVMGAYDDMLNGGICNMSRHADLKEEVLEDLSFTPGENEEFLAAGPLRGTPLRTVPALVKPGIRLGDEYYVTEGQFVRDNAYRAIQRGLLGRDRGYREEWNRRQKRMLEEAFPKIMGPQFKGATVHRSVFYREAATGNWAESDLVVVFEDVLLVVEAKAGVMAMASPAVDFERHMASVERLIVAAHRQCGRFLEYLASGSRMPIYQLEDGEYRRVAEIALGDFRKVLPIGLTVESFSPFSSCLNDVEAAEPLLGTHAFMSMSVDDLFVLKRFLPTAGELFHYLGVRQEAGAVAGVMLMDEMEYLGAYIVHNRFDADLREQAETAGFVLWNAFADIVDRYFEGEHAGAGPVPRQEYPRELAAALRMLDKKRPRGWMGMDAAIRNLGGEAREGLSRGIAGMKASLRQHPCRWMGLPGAEAMQVCVCAAGSVPKNAEVRRRAEAACIALEAPSIRVLRLSYKKSKRLTDVDCGVVKVPAKSRSDYGELQREAAAQRGRAVYWGEGGAGSRG